MRLFLPILLAAALLGLAATASAQLLTTFGNSATNAGGWTYTPATSTLSGTEGLGASIFGSALNSDITGSTSLRLTANAATAPAGFFTITIEDGAGHDAVAQFRWSDFVGGASVTADLDYYSSFEFDDIASWSLDSGGSLQSLDVSLSQVAAVPEPSTFAILIPALAGLLAWRRSSASRRA